MLSFAVFTVLVKCVSVPAYISWRRTQSAEICSLFDSAMSGVGLTFHECNKTTTMNVAKRRCCFF